MAAAKQYDSQGDLKSVGHKMPTLTYEQFAEKMMRQTRGSEAAKKLAEKYPEYYREFLAMVEWISQKVIEEAEADFKKRNAVKKKRRDKGADYARGYRSSDSK